MKNTYLYRCLVLFSLIFSFSLSSFGNSCKVALEGYRGTAESYIKQGRKLDHQANSKSPKYNLLNMSKERKAIVGTTEVPPLLQKFTGENLKYLSLTSINTDDGYSIKYNTPPVGSAAYRFATNWAPKASGLKEALVGTNLFVTNPRTAKQAPGKYLIEGPVVLIHMHGFGTATAEGATGLSIAEALYQHEIPVISMDLPGHGMGTRYAYRNIHEFADWVLNGLAPKLIDPKTQIIFSGHSGGAELAILMHQISHLPMFDRVLSFIPMSGPADATFGGTLLERSAAQKKSWDTIDEWGHMASKEDVEFVSNNVKSGKVALSPQFYTEIFGMGYSWDMSFLKNAAELKPVFSIMGDADALVYVPDRVEQDKYNKAITEINGGSYLLIGNGRTFDSENKMTGHNPFDVLMTKEQKLEAGIDVSKEVKLVYHRIAEFISEKAGLKPVEYRSTGQVEPTAYSLLDRINTLYSHHLAFRPFINDYIFVTKVAKGFGELNKLRGQLATYIKAHGKAMKKHNDEALATGELQENGVTLPNDIKNITEAQAKMASIQDIMKGTYISESVPSGVKAQLEQNLTKQSETLQKIQAVKKQKVPLDKEYAKLLKEKIPLIQKINEIMSRNYLPTEALKAMEEQLNSVYLENWIKSNDKFTTATKNHLYKLADEYGVIPLENRDQILNLPQEILDTIPEFAVARKEFETAYRDLVEAKYQAALAGAYNSPGRDIQALLLKLIGKTDSIAQPAEGSMLARMFDLEVQIEALQAEANQLLRSQDQLQYEFYSAESPYYEAFKLEMAEFLKIPYEEAVRLIEDPEKGQYYRKAIISMLARWKDIMGPEREKITTPSLHEKDKLNVQKVDLDFLN